MGYPFNNAEDLRFFGAFERFHEDRCPICYEELEIDEEDITEEYGEHGDYIYHAECIKEAIRELGDKYIVDKGCVKEYIEWLWCCTFERGIDVVPSVVRDIALGNTQGVYEFIIDDWEDFLEWYENAKETQIK